MVLTRSAGGGGALRGVREGRVEGGAEGGWGFEGLTSCAELERASWHSLSCFSVLDSWRVVSSA